jgi:hypothetical protein
MPLSEYGPSNRFTNQDSKSNESTSDAETGRDQAFITCDAVDDDDRQRSKRARDEAVQSTEDNDAGCVLDR